MRSMFSLHTANLAKENALLSSRLQERLSSFFRPRITSSDGVTEGKATAVVPEFRMPEAPEPPAFETNRRMEELIREVVAQGQITKDSASLLRSLNDLGVNMLAEFAKNAKDTGDTNRRLLIGTVITAAIAAVTLIASGWLAYLSLQVARTSDHRLELIHTEIGTGRGDSQRLLELIQQELKQEELRANETRKLLDSIQRQLEEDARKQDLAQKALPRRGTKEQR